MTRDSRQATDFYTQVDITPSSPTAPLASEKEILGESVQLLRELVVAQERQNELLQELVQFLTGQQKQRAAELGQWKQANPELARGCRRAAEALSGVQTAFIERLAEEVADQSELFYDGEFLFNEFVDRYGPRLAHLNGLMQVLSQLGSNSAATGLAQRD